MPRSRLRDGKITEQGCADLRTPVFLWECIATRQGRVVALRVCFRRKRRVFESTTIAKAPATKFLKMNKHGYWIVLFPHKMSRNASLRGDEYRLSVYGSLIALKGAQVCAAFGLSCAGDSICTGPAIAHRFAFAWSFFTRRGHQLLQDHLLRPARACVWQ
jgi:hypothetical protein